MKRLFIYSAFAFCLYSCSDNNGGQGGGNPTNTPDSTTLNPAAVDGTMNSDTGASMNGTGTGTDTSLNGRTNGGDTAGVSVPGGRQ